MILKEQDDRWRDIRILEGFLNDPRCDLRVKGRVEDEIRKLKAGDRGERMAAHVLDTHLGKNTNWIVLHDLRIVHDGEVAQIDHLLVNRLLDFWVLESKNFANGVKINDHGEFVTFVDNRPRGADSPIEQNRRHLAILQRMIDGGGLVLPTRLGFTLKPRLRSLILISGGSITRPRVPVPGLETVIRSDQAVTYIEQADARGNALDLARLIGQERLGQLGEQLKALHQPIQFDWERRLFAAAGRQAGLQPATSKPTSPKPASAVQRRNSSNAKLTAELTCQDCTVEVSRGVAQYCRRNEERFDGRLLCVTCQGKRMQPAATRIFG
jgi:hypothetical protein